MAWWWAPRAFQSSPVPKDGCNLAHSGHEPFFRLVSILTRPEGRVQQHRLRLCAAVRRVSILTRPEGRVQPDFRIEGEQHRQVSILTRPEGRVQRRRWWNTSSSCWRFQSSPVPKDGCNRPRRALGVFGGRFNPHPSRRTGATRGEESVTTRFSVSILTRPEGRVQPQAHEVLKTIVEVSILTRPEGRVQPSPAISFGAGVVRFNPHPSRRTGATRRGVSESSPRIMFQSSPVPKDGCND